MRSYITITVRGSSGAGPCAVKCACCTALVATSNVRVCVSAWEFDQ